MALSNYEKTEIIEYVKSNWDGESVCDDELDDMVVFTFDRKEEFSFGTESVLELLQRGFFILYAVINDEGNFEIAISNGEEFKN